MARLGSHTSKLGAMIVLVFIYFIVELVLGHVLNSITLVADSFHMLSDFIALIIGIAARRIGKWPKSSKNTFGWQRAEVVGTLLNTVMLTTLTFTILIETIQRFISIQMIEKPKLLLCVGVGGLLINIIGLIILRGDHGHSHNEGIPNEVLIKDDDEDAEADDHGDGNVVINEGRNHHAGHAHNPKKHSHEAGQMNLKAVFLHVLADFFGSVAVVVSALIIWLVPNTTVLIKTNSTSDGKNKTDEITADPWKGYIDPSISLLMVVLILSSTIPLLKKSALILLQSVPKEVSIKKLKKRMEDIVGENKVHDLHVWLLQSDVIIGTVHIRCTNDNYVDVSKKAKKLFHDFNIHCTTIQAEFDEHVDEPHSHHSGDSENNKCVLNCDRGSLTTGNNECTAKESCCPTKSSGAVPGNNNLRTDESAEVRKRPLISQQKSAPCLTSIDASRSHSSVSQQEEVPEWK